MTLTARPGLAILLVALAALVLSLSGTPAQAQDGSVSDQDEEPDVSYVTVVVDRTPEPSVAQFTVTWNDAHEGECSTQYNAYLVDYFVDTEDVHLGSATSDDVQIVKTVDSSGMDGGLGYAVNMVCGDYRDTYDYRYVSRIRLLGGLPSGTYSSEPALIGLVVDSGSLEPAFHQYKFSYVVDDVPASRERITVTATAKDGLYSIVFVEGHVRWTGQGCGASGCQFNYDNESREELDTLEDVDADTPGFQLDLEEGQTDFSIHVHPLVDGGNVYQFSVTSSTPEPSLRSYITVVVAEDTSDPDNPQTDFTITWSDVDACSTGYNAYFSNSLDVAGGGETTHLGSATTDGSQIASSLSNVEGEGIVFRVKLYCGTEDSGRLVSSVMIPHDDGPSSEESNRRLVPSTYSSEPPLTALTVSPGTLTPTFHSHTPSYTVEDVVSDKVRLTLVATAKPGYGVVFVKDIIGGTISCSPWSLSCQGWNYQDGDGNRVYPLTDADANVTGFQVDLAVGEELSMHVIREYRGVPLENQFYRLTVARSSNSLATGAPTISGTAQVGERLTADTSNIGDPDGISNATFSYQWIAGTADISGATGFSYAPLVADLGKTIKVRVSFEDNQNNFESLTSAPTGAVTTSPYGAVIWSGTMTVGMLQIFGVSLFGFDAPNAGTSLDIGDLEPSEFSYAGNSYIIETIAHFSDSGELEFGLDVPLVSGDFNLNLDGTPFLVRSDGNTSLYAFSNHGLSWTNGQEVAVRLAVNRPATGAPVIGGTAQVGETLAADISGIGDDDGLPAESEFDYQWVRNDGSTDANIAGATDSTYVLLAADVGKFIKVRVTFTDKNDYTETLTSAATAAAAQNPGPITGFTVVDASDQSVEGTLADGGTLALDAPVGGSFGIRADLESGATIGSMSLQLTGEKTHDQTENIAPYSLYGDSGGNLSGESLPVGEYTLTADRLLRGAPGRGPPGNLEGFVQRDRNRNTAAQHSSHRLAQHQRNSAGGRDAHRGHVRD